MRTKKAKLEKGIVGLQKLKSILKQSSQNTTTLKPGREHKVISESEVKNLQKLIADIATGVWRMRNKFLMVNVTDLPNEIKKAYRHLDSIWDTLTIAKVEIRDHTNEKYVPGMALKVIAFQPTSCVLTETIRETIKPSVFYKDTLIQAGEVIVATPDTAESKKNANIEDISESKERHTQ